MASITIFIPKYRIAETNRKRWKFNKHKKPFYFTTELNNIIRSGEISRLWFRENYKGFYEFKR